MFKKSLVSLLYGEDYVSKMEHFEKGVLEIESENSDLFDERGLSSYYIITVSQSSNIATIAFTEDTLPATLQKGVLNLFGKIFPKL